MALNIGSDEGAQTATKNQGFFSDRFFSKKGSFSEKTKKSGSNRENKTKFGKFSAQV